MAIAVSSGRKGAVSELDLVSGGISQFLNELANDGMRILELPSAVRRVTKSDSWSAAVRKRIEGIVRAHARRLLSSRITEKFLEAAVKSINACSEIVRKFDRDLASRLTAWSDLIGDVLYERAVMTPDRARTLKHVPAALAVLYEHEGWVRRADLMKKLELEPANMTRVMKSALASGLVLSQNHVSDSTVSYCLSEEERSFMVLEKERFASKIPKLVSNKSEKMTNRTYLVRAMSVKPAAIEDLISTANLKFEDIQVLGTKSNSKRLGAHYGHSLVSKRNAVAKLGDGRMSAGKRP
jgi:hypothetical protein